MKIVTLFFVLAVSVHGESKAEHDLQVKLAAAAATIEARQRELDAALKEKSALSTNVATLARENAVLRARADANAAKAETLGGIVAETQSQLRSSIDTAQTQALAAATQPVARDIARIATERNRQVTVQFAKQSATSELAAAKAGKAADLGMENNRMLIEDRRQILRHTEMLAAIARSQDSFQRLIEQVVHIGWGVLALCLFIIIAFIIFVFRS